MTEAKKPVEKAVKKPTEKPADLAFPLKLVLNNHTGASWTFPELHACPTVPPFAQGFEVFAWNKAQLQQFEQNLRSLGKLMQWHDDIGVFVVEKTNAANNL